MASSTNTEADEVAKLVAIVKHRMRARDNDASLDKVINRTVEIAGQFGGRNITDFLATYKIEMQQRDVIEEKQISRLKRVMEIGLQGRIREIQATHTTWVGFERALLAEYILEDALRMTHHTLMKWIEKKGTNVNTSGVYTKFDQMYNRLPRTDQTLLEGDKVLYFLKAVDWVAVRRTCDRFDKRRRCLDDYDMAADPEVQRRKDPIVTEMTKLYKYSVRKLDGNSKPNVKHV